MICTKQTARSRATLIEEIHNYRLLITKYNIRHPSSTSARLDFWKTYAPSFPYLFKLARQLVWTPATSVPTESAFSVSAYVARKERSRLSSEILQQLFS